MDDKKTPALPAVVTPPAPAASASSPVAPSPAIKGWEQWATDKNIPMWKAEAARHGRAWPMGQEVTEAAFDQAIHDAFHARIG